MMKWEMCNLWMRMLPLLFCFLMNSGCASLALQSKPSSVPEVRPGILAGYLPFEAACNSLALLPPPPAAGSAAATLDEEVSRKNLTLQGSPRWTLAASDADLSLPHAAGTFSCALGIPISEEDTPRLHMLLRRTFTDAIIATLKAKNHYRRVRPFAVNKAPTCAPQKENNLKEDGSYPSGHSAVGWAWALILSELDPEHGDAVLARGRAFGESRLVCNVHWHSDVVEGRFIGAAVVSRLHANPAFLDELNAAKAEIASVRAKGRKPTRNCADEAAALARQSMPAP
jgi:acid phosphatase (class A)